MRPVSIYCIEKNKQFDKNFRHNFLLEFETWFWFKFLSEYFQ
jgi:hypothetical protein